LIDQNFDSSIAAPDSAGGATASCEAATRPLLLLLLLLLPRIAHAQV
jgi:hypothetical protein